MNDGTYDFSNIIFLVEPLEQYGDSLQFHIARLIIPTHGRDGILWLEKIGDGRVVHDDNVFHGAAQPGQVLDVGVVKVCAVLAEE